MKVRFNSPKERNPTQENGLEVLYAPGKRLAFRVRWYLIVLLILFPALWLASRYGLDLIRIEAPALVRLPMLDIRARQAGHVQALQVQVGDHVAANNPLLELDNPEWDLRLALLQGQQTRAPSASLGSLQQRNDAVLQSLVSRAAQHVRDVRQLVDRNAATRGELLDAQNALDSREAELLAFQRSQAGGVSTREDARYAQAQAAEKQWLIGQQAGLKLIAPEAGRVAEILVGDGENVGPGTPLLRLEREGPAQLWIYLDPKDIDHAAPGSPVEVGLPDGSWVDAQVLSPAESANPLPTDLRKPFSSPTRGLLVPARFITPLASEWRVDSLPVKYDSPTSGFAC